MSKLIVYNASAGSGKTYNLALEYIALLIKNPEAYRHILAITFTNKATKEMKERIIAFLQQLAFLKQGETNPFMQQLCATNSEFTPSIVQQQASKALKNIIHNYSYFNIKTIDSFLQEVMRNMTRELGVDSNYAITLSENDVMEQAIERLIESTEENKSLYEWYKSLIDEKISEGKSPNSINRDLKNFSFNLSKEEFWKYEEAIEQMPQSVISDFKKKATAFVKGVENQMVGYADKLAQLNTKYNLSDKDYVSGNKGFISIGKKLRDLNPEIFTATIQKIIDNNCVLKDNNPAEPFANALLKEVVSFFDKIDWKQYYTYKAELKNLNSVGMIRDLILSRNEILKEENLVLLSSTSQILSKMIASSGEVDVPFIYEKISLYLSTIMIDEMQDTSINNWVTLSPFIFEGLDKGEKNILLGDVKQSIYRWRNASWSILKNIEEIVDKHYGNDGKNRVEFKPLQTNFRSAKKIIDFNNDIFNRGLDLLKDNMLSEEKDNMLSDNQRNIVMSVFSEVKQQSARKEEGVVRCFFLQRPKGNKEQQRSVVNERVKEELQYYHSIGYNYKDIAMLFRKNKELQGMAEYLNGEGFSVVSDVAFSFKASKGVCYIIDALKYIALEDKVSLLHMVKNMQDMEQGVPDWLCDRDSLLLKSLFDLVVFIIEKASLDKIKGDMLFLSSFCDAVQNYTTQHSSNISDFLTYWEDELKDKQIVVEDNKTIDSIKLYTIHKAKGLQYPVVIIPYDFDFFSSSSPFKRNCLWISDEAQQVPAFYIDWDSTMQKTKFIEQYKQEKAMQYVDSLNTMYVAFTRPEDCLSVFAFDEESNAKTNKKKQYCIDTFSKFMYSCLKDSIVPYEDKDDVKFFTNNSNWKKQITQSLQENDSQTIEINSLFVPNTNVRFSNRQEAKEFVDALRQDTVLLGQKRRRGIVFHSIMSQIRDLPSKETLMSLVQKQIAQGNLSLQDADKTMETLALIFSSEPMVNQWFNGQMQVINESSIVFKTQSHISVRKPDRIMIGPDRRVVIVDYKFSAYKSEHPQYTSQLNEYASLLGEIGFTVSEAFLWFIDIDNLSMISKVEKVI